MGRAKKHRKARMDNKMERSMRRSNTPVFGGPYPFLDSFYGLPGVGGIDNTRMKKLMDELGKAASKMKIVMPKLVIDPKLIAELSASNQRVHDVFKRMRSSSDLQRTIKMVDETFKGEDKMEQEKQYGYEDLLEKFQASMFAVNPETITVIFNQVAQVASQPKVGFKINKEDSKKVSWLSVKPGASSLEFGDLMELLVEHIDKVPYGTLTVVYNQVAGLAGEEQMTQVEGDVSDLEVYGEDAPKWEAMEV